jgi:endoglucanase
LAGPGGLYAQYPGDWGPTKIDSGIVDLVGRANADIYWATYEANYVAEEDIAQIAAWGMNSIRLPFHYNRFLARGVDLDTSGYAIVDQLIEWCRPHNLHIILDMHCAPGSQSGSTSISDAPVPGRALLWIDPLYQDLTVEIWTQIAARYANETLIAAYDVINEPVLTDGATNKDMRAFYLRLTDSIRTVDQNHLLFFEGNWYATNFDDLPPRWDDNMGFAFHRYWGPPTFTDIQNMYNLSIAQQIPIWLGETGENSNTWYYDMTRVAAEAGFGWNWWTHKKFEKITSPYSAKLPEDYSRLQAYWNGTGSKPSVNDAFIILMQMADNLRLEKCDYRPGVIPALMEADFGLAAQPWPAGNPIPGFVAAIDYDLGVQGQAYNDNTYWSTGGNSSYNTGYGYRNDGVDIEWSQNTEIRPYNVGWTEDGEWIQYTVQIAEAGNYDINFHVASAIDGSRFQLLLNGSTSLGGIITAPNTGDWQNWQVLTVSDVELPAGEHQIKLDILTGGTNFLGFDFLGFGYTPVVRGTQSTRFAVYPNPSNGQINALLPAGAGQQAELILYNVVGQEVWRATSAISGQQQRAASWQIPAAIRQLLASGTYFYRLKTPSGATNGKLLLLTQP